MRYASWSRGLILCVVLLPVAGFAQEWNLWPLSVRTLADEFGRPQQTDIFGPFGSERIMADRTIVSIRPLFTHFQHLREPAHWHVVYPFFNYYHYENGYHWHMINLVRGSRQGDNFQFEAFPFIFLNQAEDRRNSYFAFWPVGGTIKQKFGRARIDFALWPLFVRTQRQGETRFHTPWPFIQTLTGPESRGFGLWPIFGHFRRDGHYQHNWALWPFFYHYQDKLFQEVPYVRYGAWPLFTRETAAGLASSTFVWPFFGYTIEDTPRPRYREARLLWPFVIQGRGEQRYVNRLLPLYAHETSPGYRKRWFGWPLLKIEHEEFANLEKRTHSLLYFLYRDRRYQAPGYQARETFLWPLFGYWNDGRGQRQMQVIDPLNVFFGGNEKIKENWSPLFALYRYDARQGGWRHSLLWNLLVLERYPDNTGTFQLGPLFEVSNDGDSGHWQILKGFLGIRRTAEGRRLRLLWNDF